MNKMRRKEIRQLAQKLESIARHADAIVDTLEERLQDISEDIGFVLFDEECYRDNIPENLQGGCRYEAADEACDALQDAIDSLDNAIRHVNKKETMLEDIAETVDYLYNAI